MSEPSGAGITTTALTDLRSELISDIRTQGESSDGLSITGLEPILLGLASKIVVSVVSGFLGRAIWDKYKSVTAKDAGAALDVLAATPPDDSGRVALSIIQEEVTEYAVAQGLPREDAEPIIARTIKRVEVRYFNGERR